MTTFRKRTRLLIARKFQIRYITLILLFMFIIAIITGYTVYMTTWLMFGEKLAAVYPQGLLFDIVKKVNMVLFLRILFLTPLVALIGLVLSNRIAGPIYSIKRFLKKIAAGDYEGHLKLRKGDELKDMAKGINNLVSKLDADRKARREQAEKIRREASELQDVITSGKCDSENLLDKIENIKKDVNKLGSS